MSYGRNLLMRFAVGVGILLAGVGVSSVHAVERVSSLADHAKVDRSGEDTWFDAMGIPKMSETEAAQEVPAAQGASKAWSVFMDYTLVSDYIWRGINLSEYANEGTERPNHMMTVGVSYDTGNFGVFTGSVWFEWYAGQKALTPTQDSHLQEVDYTLAWSYDLSNLNANIPLSVELGWIWYSLPRASGDADLTQEWYISVALDDSKIFGTEDPVFNPYITFYDDVDDVKGSWLEFGISHDFALADCGMGETPFLKDITLTPSFVMGTDVSYLGATTRLAAMQYGLDIGYDLSSALNIPDRYGTFSLTGFVYFSDAIFEAAINDEFYGGITLGWEL